MFRFSLSLILGLLFCILSAYGQTYQDNLLWSWTRVSGQIDSNFLPEQLDEKLLGSLEIHYRLNENAHNFQTLILRPMLGYKLKDNSTLWMGYAYIEADSSAGIKKENRFFQMITYSSKLKTSPIVFMGNTRIEERFLEDSNNLALRVRQMLRLSFNLFKIKKTQIIGFIQNEYFYNLNNTDTVLRGFNQNRALVGLGFKNDFKNTDVSFNIGYMNNYSSNGKLVHGVNLGVSFKINNKKSKQKKIFK
ncbi:MAG: DUF2490 domain-containing protein [Bacteriovoracaceae bacterium]|jgi:hypothetical protein|nr:DUF2490 domain-containing protein [Bacteriovoracaceae bacterium]